ncbi:MAG: hypothetical protein GEU90_15830 [Gemmatimonas sp.]|nr:hypothetical protein [Gemmatimonas sp.]
MRKIVLVGMCSVVLAAVLAGVGASASPSDDVFRGSWTSIDIDGSHQMLDIRGSGQSGHYAMVLFDDSATLACDGSPVRFQGSGLVDGNSLLMTGAITCIPGGNPLQGRISIRFVYNPGTDTLTDDFGVTWYRA